MKPMLTLMAGLCIASVVMPARGDCDVLSVAPTDVAITESEESDRVYVAVRFDLSGLRSGTGRQVDHAHLEWRIPGIATNVASEFRAHQVTETWNALSVEGGTLPTCSEVEAASWAIEGLDHERAAGLMRLDVQDLVAQWASGRASNHGLILEAELPGIAAENLQGRLLDMMLVVRYGFVRSD